ncbi:Aquaporin-1, partial [Hyphodiscus hymeniophilus]
ARNHFVATSAEFTGTTLFLFFAFSGTQVALLSAPASGTNEIGAVSDPAQLLYISLCFGFSLAVNAWVFFRISGGLFNPAVSQVTLGMCLVGALPYMRGALLTISQILGGITAAAIVSALFPGPLTVRTSLGGGTSITQGLFIEMFLSAQLVFTIFMLAAEKHKGTFIAPVGIGLSLFIAELTGSHSHYLPLTMFHLTCSLTGVYYTGGSVNPARSFGPSVVARSFHSYHWIYWVGPILGALLASGFYLFIKMLEYETANPGQDAAKEKGEHFDPDLDQEHPHVAFAPEEYATPGRTVTDQSTQDSRAGLQNGNSSREGTGFLTEYGPDGRPFSRRPASTQLNDQFAGSAERGMAAERTVRPIESRRESRRSSDRRSSDRRSSDRPVRLNEAASAGMKPAMKKNAVGGMPSKERSVRANTRNNRYANSGIPRDEEFFDQDYQ